MKPPAPVSGEISVDTGAGNDTVDIKAISGNTVLQTNDGDDTVNISSGQGLVNQIGALLTVAGGADVNTLNVVDSQNETDTVGELTESSLRGLNMPSVAEIQTIYVQGKSGTYTLAAGDYGNVTLDFDATVTQVAAAFNTLFGTTNEVKVEETVDIRQSSVRSRTYKVTFNGVLAGLDMPEFTLVDKSLMTAHRESSAEVKVTTRVEGTTPPCTPVHECAPRHRLP